MRPTGFDPRRARANASSPGAGIALPLEEGGIVGSNVGGRGSSGSPPVKGEYRSLKVAGPCTGLRSCPPCTAGKELFNFIFKLL